MPDARVLLTGLPRSSTAWALLAHLLEVDGETQFVLLVDEAARGVVDAWLSQRPEGQQARVELVLAELTALDLGLSGEEHRALAASLTMIHHCAAVSAQGITPAAFERLAIGGTFELLELARTAERLERFVHWSSPNASAPVQGVVSEEDRVEPRAGSYAHARYVAETLVERARGELPTTVLRSAHWLCDAESGSVTASDGAHLLFAWLLGAPSDVPLSIPLRADALLHVVPSDYALAAALLLSKLPETLGRTFHLVDAEAWSVEEALRIAAAIAGRMPPRLGVPKAVLQAVLRLPGLERFSEDERVLLDEVASPVRYDDARTRALLESAGLRCPPLGTYLDKLIGELQRTAHEGARGRR